MTAIANLSDLVNKATGGNSGAPECLPFYKDGRVNGAAAAAPVAGRYTSLWRYEGTPSHGAVPSTVAAPDNTTQGGLKQTDPGGGKEKFLIGAYAHANAVGTLILYDRLLHIGGLNGTTLTAQTVAGSLTRYTNGAGNQIWIEVNTQIGASSTTISASYTDQDGNSGQTTPAVAIGNTGLREAERIIPLTLAAGDTGVQAVASVTLAGTTGTAGNFGVVVAHPLLYIPISVLGVGALRDCISSFPGPIEIEADACLAWAWLANTTTIPQVAGMLNFVDS